MFGFHSLPLAHEAAGKVVFSLFCLTFLWEEGAAWRCPGTRALTSCCQMGLLLPQSAQGAASRKHIPASAGLYLLETEKMEKLRGLGGCFGARGKGGAPGAPGPAAGAAAPCPSQYAFVRRFPEDRESLPPWSVSQEKGILCTPWSQGAEIQRGPVMLPSFLLAAAPVPAPGALGEVPRAGSAPTPHPNAPSSGSSTQTPFVPTGWAWGHLRALLGGFGSSELWRRVVHIPCRQAVPSGGTPGATAPAQSVSQAGAGAGSSPLREGEGLQGDLWVRREVGGSSQMDLTRK